MLDLEVIDEPSAAIAALGSTRARILRHLAVPGSASTVARELGFSRQVANYHVRALEAHGLVSLVEKRSRRGLTERVVQATARGYLVAPDALGTDVEPSRVDRHSSRFLVALAARMVKEVADLARRAEQAGKPLPTLAIDTEVRFRSAAERAEFTAALAAAVTDLTARYHDESAAGGRWHRLVIAAHPRPSPRDHTEGAS